MWKFLKLFLITFCVKIFAEKEEVNNSRQGKLLPIFQVVKFPNDVCTGATRNGTCYTAEECSSKGGTNDGSCASGFGVCCVIKLACGGSTSVNNSYIVQTAVTALTSPCTYSVCPCSSDICRIRYDFTAHTLAQPSTIPANAGAPTGADTAGVAIGDCTTDAFSITSPGNYGSPIICGANSGQHMILDSSGTDCQQLNFNIGASTTTSRSWDIYVTQFNCGQEDEAGPPGCLQYHTGSTGLVKTFNYFPSNTATTIDASTTHLQNQRYNICVRREKGMCYICWAQLADNTFGLSISGDAAAAQSLSSATCTTDFVLIPQATTAAIAAKSAIEAANVDRLCGRLLNTINANAAHVSVCSRSYPFQIGVNTDDSEVCTNAADAKADVCETSELPGGILGFALGYGQFSC